MKIRYTIVLPYAYTSILSAISKEEVAAARIQEVPDGLKLTVSVTSLQSGAEGFELLTSAVQSQSTIIADVRYCSRTQHLKWVSLSSSSLP